MCYDVKASLKSQLKRAIHNGGEAAIKEIQLKLIPLTDLPLYHASGFQHPKLLIYTDRSPYLPEVAVWGLIPHWVKDQQQKSKFWNNTLNACGETIFEKPSFRNSAKSNRCIIYVDGFYEHHHYKGKTYPYFIYAKDNEPLALAGLWSEWVDKTTGELINSFSIVTTIGNSVMTKIHNNPKADGPRMPVILPKEMEDKWLAPINYELDKKEIMELITAYPDDALQFHAVHRLRGKEYMGNVETISEPFDYPELVLE